MKLYEITDDMREIQALVESGELTQEMVADTMEGLEGQFNDKARATLKVRQAMLGDIASIDLELERLTNLKKSLKGNVEWLMEYIKNNMLISGNDKLDLGIFKVTLRKSTEQLGEVDESKLDEKYFSVIPESRKLDKKALLKDAKVSSINGVKLTESKRSLTIK